MLYKHALRNGAIPLVTYLGLQFGGLIGGVVVDRAGVQLAGHGQPRLRRGGGARLSGAAGECHRARRDDRRCVNLLVDIAYAALDPRIGAG